MYSRVAEISRSMLALGVVIAAFEEQFERQDGDAGAQFHRDWEDAVAAWWRHAETFDSFAATEVSEEARVAHAASLARMFRLA